MDFEILYNYGVAGCMLIYFMYDKITFQKDIKQLINNNTIALTRFYESMKYKK